MKAKRRAGASLVEVILGLTILTMMLVPIVGMMGASIRIWRQFESGHGSVSVRQTAIQEVANRLRNGAQVLSISPTRIRFRSTAGDTQQVMQTGGQIFWQRAGNNQLIADSVGRLQMRQLARGGSTRNGETVEIRLENPTTAGVANRASTVVVWLKPSI